MAQGRPIKPFISSRQLLLICLSAFFAITFFSLWLQTDNANGFQRKLKEHLRKKLVSIDPLPPETKADAIYILGGPQNSLKLKFKTASELYNKEICNKILILHSPGITEYSPNLQRNFTNDEWSILQLQKFGIPKQNIEPISMKGGFFGTLSEAKGISKLIKERLYKTVILITSPHHTHRVKNSFENFLQNNNIKLYVQGSEEKSSLVEITAELIKLKVYQYMLVSRKK